MKCKYKGCFTETDYSCGYCYRHTLMASARKKITLNNGICNKKGCKNKVVKGKDYCELHNWYR